MNSVQFNLIEGNIHLKSLQFPVQKVGLFMFNT